MEELDSAYLAKGVEMGFVSNYHQFRKEAQKEHLDVYEHGFNLKKVHKLAIGAEKVSYWDFPFWQNLSQKQFIINEIKRNNGLVALAHPNLKNGHSLEELKKLTNYEFIEIRSNYARAEKHWDMALSTGHKVWALANDDTHDIRKQVPGTFYNVIPESKENLRNLLSQGSYYAVEQKRTTEVPVLESLVTYGDKIHFSFSGHIYQVTGIGDGEEIFRSAQKDGTFLFPERCSYVRLEVEGPGYHLYLNPILRYNGSFSQDSLPVISYSKTLIYRITILIGMAGLVTVFFGKTIFKRVDLKGQLNKARTVEI